MPGTVFVELTKVKNNCGVDSFSFCKNQLIFHSPAFPFATTTTSTDQNYQTTAATTPTTTKVDASTTANEVPLDISGN